MRLVVPCLAVPGLLSVFKRNKTLNTINSWVGISLCERTNNREGPWAHSGSGSVKCMPTIKALRERGLVGLSMVTTPI